MAFNETINDRIREVLAVLPDVEEKHMFGGVCYMVNGKMCVGVLKDEMMCRVDPEIEEKLLEKNGCRMMDFTGRHMKGYVLVNEEAMKTEKALRQWVDLCIDFNSRAKASKKKTTAKKTTAKKSR